MTIDRSFEIENARQRERLSALVRRLGPADLARSLGHGWTVADALVHLAFWDLRASVLLDRVARGNLEPSQTDVEVINETVRQLSAAIPSPEAPRLAVSAAEQVDRRIEALADSTIQTVRAAGNPVNLPRHPHRREHLDEIERLLGSPPGS